MPSFSINNGGVNTNKKGMPSIDDRYGPYPDLETALNVLGPEEMDVLTEGLTIGIQEVSGGPISEFWFQPDPSNPGQLKLVSKQEDPVLSEEITTSVGVGGIPEGAVYPEGTKIEDILSDLISPIIHPTFENPSATLSYSVDTYYAVGDLVPTRNATITYNPGAIKLNGIKKQDRGGNATDYRVYSTGADTNIDMHDSGNGSFSISNLSRSTKGNIVVSSTVSYAQGPQPLNNRGESDGEPLPAGVTQVVSKTIQFIVPFYHGVSSESSINNFSGMTRIVSGKNNKTINYTTNNQYLVFAYDADYGNLSSILDENNFDVTSGWNVSDILVAGSTYRVYVSKLPTTDTNAAFTFKF